MPLLLMLNQAGLSAEIAVQDEFYLADHLWNLADHKEYGALPVLARGPATTRRQAQHLKRISRKYHESDGAKYAP
jgi:hypothetical protein